MCMTPDLQGFKTTHTHTHTHTHTYTVRPQRCKKITQSAIKNLSIYSLSLRPSRTVLVNRSLSDMHEGSQRCQHLQCLDRPLKPDPRKHTHTRSMPSRAAHMMGRHANRNPFGKVSQWKSNHCYNSSNNIPATHTHTHLRESVEDYGLWSLDGDYKNERGGKLLCVILTELNTTLSGDKTMGDSTSKGLWVMESVIRMAVLWVSVSLFSLKLFAECKENSGDLHTAAEENRNRLPETISKPFPSFNAGFYSSTESGPQKLFYWLKESIQKDHRITLRTLLFESLGSAR